MTSQPEWKIPLTELAYGKEEEDAVLDVLRSRWLTMGPRTQAFEKRVAELAGTDYAVSLSSCTAGLYLMLAALDIGPGDEVLVPSLTFVATVNVIVNRGATPVFCDVISPELPLMDPREIARNLSPLTRAVLTVDYAGYPCDYDAIMAAIDDYEANSQPPDPTRRRQSIHLLEDAAHGIGGALDEQRSLGNCGDAGVFSFFSNKNLATGEGGMVITNRSDIAEKVRLFRQHGLTVSTWERHKRGPMEYDVVAPGWNFRPTEIQAALGLAQIEKLEVNQWKRHTLVRRYQARLAEIPEVTVPFAQVKTWYFPACHVFPILLPDVAARITVRETLQGRGIQTSHHYPPVHRFDFYRSQVPTAGVSLPKTENYSERELTLPLHPNMTPEQIDWIAESIKEGLGKKR
ncbi:DegT/DnrJ/EryC1/StrS family aminotransferase [Candidatus Sumerlaeota bacterium]|nr:DegT/DnrJ/EryC1/StrS family aminotransferase [Candidatus Sumerlaeota bacterium]MBI3737269.1 DegT/DnrJ/EryC1/StrS family aminotransferase [Candidatus Sumerlaeota bacterium]